MIRGGSTHLHENSHRSTTAVTAALPDRPLEAIGPPPNVAALWHNLQFIFVIGDDLRELILDVFGINRLASDRSKGLGSVLELALFDKVSWRFRKDEKADAQDQCPQELNRNGDPVRSTIVAALCRIDYTVGHKDAFRGLATRRHTGKNIPNCNAKLIARYKCSADFLRSNLRHVQDDNSRYIAHTYTGYQSTHNHQCEIR